jgi:hypothetical protein
VLLEQQSALPLCVPDCILLPPAILAMKMVKVLIDKPPRAGNRFFYSNNELSLVSKLPQSFNRVDSKHETTL